VHGELGETSSTRALLPGRKLARTARRRSQAQVEARGLYLVGLDRLERDDLLRRPDEVLDVLRREDAGRVRGGLALARRFRPPAPSRSSVFIPACYLG